MKQGFFIIGSGRSGTTYLHHLLKDHPRIALTNEARVLDAIGLAFEGVTLPWGERSPTRGFQGVIHPSAVKTFAPIFLRHARQMLEDFYAETFDHDFTHWGDKLPDPWCAVVGKQLFPDLLLVVIVRDARDVVCSYRALQRVPDPKMLGPRSEEMLAMSAADFARVWKETYENIRDNVADYHLVRYPELLAAPIEVAESVLRFLGLGMDPAVARAREAGNLFAGHGTSSTPEASLARWKGELSPEELAEIEALCRPMMELFGMPW